MIMCLCRAVSDREVSHCIAGGAETIDDVTRGCGAGSDCGSCRSDIEACLGDHALRKLGVAA